MTWWDYIQSRALLLTIILGSLVGLIGAFGHHTHTHDAFPNRNWWLSRLAITPFLAGAAAMIVEVSGFHSNVFAHFVASLLALLGFQSIPMMTRLIEARLGLQIGEVRPDPVVNPETVIPPNIYPVDPVIPADEQVLLGEIDQADAIGSATPKEEL